MSPVRRLRTRYQGLEGAGQEPVPPATEPEPEAPTEEARAQPPESAPEDAPEGAPDDAPARKWRRRFSDARDAEGPVIVHMRPVPAPPPPPASTAPAVGAESGSEPPAAGAPAARVFTIEGPSSTAVAAAPASAPTTGTPARRWRRLRGLARLKGLAFVVGLALAAFITGVVLFNNVVMPRLIHGAGQVDVPDLANLTLEQAEQALRPLNLQLSRAGERFDAAVPRGFVLSQDPGPGTSVRGRRRISVVVSLGEEFSSVPELFGESQRSAEQLLRSAGLRVGPVTRAPSEEVGVGMVAGSDPGPESVLPRDAVVSLLISSGAGEHSFVMPDLLGREPGAIRRQLESFGFRVLMPGSSAGTIVSQRPAPGARITRSTEIVLQPSGRLIR